VAGQGGGSVPAVANLDADVPATALAVYAHPDDPEVSVGGTLAAWAERGTTVHVCICAAGDKGAVEPLADPAELVARRRGEVAAAGELLGVAEHHWMDYPDGEIEDDLELRSRLVHLIRHVRPDVVVGADPTAVYFGQHYVNHRDHRSVGWATIDAVSPAAGNPNYFPDAGPPHQVSRLYLSGTLEPDVWIDTTRTIDRKAQAVACHASQVGKPGEWLRRVVRERAEQAGRQAGVRFAESFRRLSLD
jgi:LmbE family N-acetylglucosaminyl deacetylase